MVFWLLALMSRAHGLCALSTLFDIPHSVSSRDAVVFMRLLTNLRDGLMTLAYPAQCQVCGAMINRYDDGVACNDCWSDATVTSLFAAPLCGKCGLPLPGRIAGNEALHCGLCG